MRIVEASVDALDTALALSRLGNFLDFAVLSPALISQEMNKALEVPEKFRIMPEDLAPFRMKLEKANALLIIGDNAEEIVFDMVLIETLKRLFPDLSMLCNVDTVPLLIYKTYLDVIRKSHLIILLRYDTPSLERRGT